MAALHWGMCGWNSVLMGSRAARVADVQRQTLSTLTIALGFTVAAPIAALVPHDTGAWLPLHLFLVGGLFSAIAGATQMPAVTWSAAPAPADRLASIQRWLIVAGVISVAMGRETDSSALVGAGGRWRCHYHDRDADGEHVPDSGRDRDRSLPSCD